MTVQALPERVFYTAYNPSTNQFVPDDQGNHTLTLRRDGANFTPTNPPTHVANGTYEVVLTAAERVGEVLLVTGVSATPSVLLEPRQFSADPRLAGMSEPDPSQTEKAMYTTQAHTNLSAHGDLTWATATGFSSPTDVSDAAASVIAHGDGAGAWGAIADTSGLALEATAQQILTTGGTGPWTTGSGGETDWTDTEKKQFRYQLGIDGVTEAPSVNTPNLSTFDPATQRVLSNLVSILGSDQRAAQHAMNIDSLVPTTVDNTNFAPTATEFETPLDETAPDHYKNRAVLFLDGPNQYAASHITGYALTGGKGHITVEGFPQAPTTGDMLIII